MNIPPTIFEHKAGKRNLTAFYEEIKKPINTKHYPGIFAEVCNLQSVEDIPVIDGFYWYEMRKKTVVYLSGLANPYYLLEIYAIAFIPARYGSTLKGKGSLIVNSGWGIHSRCHSANYMICCSDSQSNME